MSPEQPICRRCESEYHLRSNHEPTMYCDLCAHEALAELAKLLPVEMFKGSKIDSRANVLWPTYEDLQRIRELLHGKG